MKIKRSMIHPSLRSRGAWMRHMPTMGKGMLRLCNRCMKLFYAGRAHTKIADYQKQYILRPDGSKLRICIYTAKGETKGKLPGVLWIHGGGYAMSIPEQDVGYVNTLMQAAPCVMVAPDYQKSCDRCYPAALEDCYLTLKWMKENADALGIDEDKLMVGGESAGGGLTVAVCLLARDQGEVDIAFQMPIYPMIDHRKTPSSTDNDAPCWNSKKNEAAWKMYLGGALSRGDVSKYASPALEHDYHGLPPMFTYVGDLDPFYSETLTYAENLQKAGVPVHLLTFRGCYHGFDAICPKATYSVRARKELGRQFLYATEHYGGAAAQYHRLAQAAQEMFPQKT